VAKILLEKIGGNLKKISLLALLSCLPGAAYAGCDALFFQGMKPVVRSERLVQVREICYEGAYGALYSYKFKNPYYVAEHMTKARVETARNPLRQNFFAEPSLKPGERAEPADYKGAGYEAGQMASYKNMPTHETQYAAFSLINTVPQNHDSLVRLWDGIDNTLRNFILSVEELYVISGPIYADRNPAVGQKRIVIPDKLFKAVFNPKTRLIYVYVIPNRADEKWEQVTVAELEALTGINVFPFLSQAEREKMYEAPMPAPDCSLKKRCAIPERQGAAIGGALENSSVVKFLKSHF
jgi:endonuclease G